MPEELIEPARSDNVMPVEVLEEHFLSIARKNPARWRDS